MTEKTKNTLNKAQRKTKPSKPELPSLWLPIPNPAPYGSVNDLFNDTRDFIESRIELPSPEDYTVNAAFDMMTWVMEKQRTCPYLFATGAHGTGKTTLLDIKRLTCYKAIQSANMTHAAIFRVLDRYHPTLLLDESEVYTMRNDEAQEIQKLLNAGYKRNNPVIRCNKDTLEVEAFDVFSPKVFAGTRQLSPTLQDRCIKILMVKNSNSVRITVDSEAESLRAKLSGFRADVLSGRLDLFDGLDVSDQRVYSSLNSFLNMNNGRAAELYSPLLITLGFLSEGKGQKGQKVNQLSDEFIEIKRHAQARYLNQSLEFQTGIDALVLKALGSLGITDMRRFRAQSIADLLNTDKTLSEQTSTNTIGFTLRRLGFQPTRMQDGNKGWLFNQKLWLNRMAEYGLEPPSASLIFTPESRDSISPLSPQKPAQMFPWCLEYRKTQSITLGGIEA